MNKFVPFMLIFFFISGFFVTTFNPVLAESVGDYWHTKASMNQARAGLRVAMVDGRIYAIGGFTEFSNNVCSNYVGTNERYDPATDTWTTLTPMPTPRANFAIAAYQSKIYCIGNGPTEVYDIATDSWSTKEYISLDGEDLQAHIVDGKIFVIAV